MKKTNKTWTYPLIVMGLVVIIANGCSLLGLDDPVLEDPIITWENPADIGFGTPLSGVQLNATANVPGTFNYSPELGTVLDIGANQNLQVTFIPDDEKTYKSVKITVQINVQAYSYGTLSDIDGNAYKTIAIGTQIWMAENLKTAKYSDNTSIPLISDDTEWKNLISPGYCWYNNDASANKSIHGALYNWYSVNTGKLCPVGWHVPIDAEWMALSTFLGGDEVAVGKLKETGTTHWGSANYPSTNSSGFTALPSGARVDGIFGYIGEGCVWWSATENGAQYAFIRGLQTFGSFNTGYADKHQGYSVRCIMN